MSDLTDGALLASISATENEIARVDRQFKEKDISNDLAIALGNYKIDLDEAYSRFFDEYEARIRAEPGMLSLEDYFAMISR